MNSNILAFLAIVGASILLVAFGLWLFDVLTSKPKPQPRPSPPQETFITEEMIQAQVMLTEIEIEYATMEARRRLIEEAQRQQKQNW